jgi:6-phosphogluconolactonase
VNPSFLTALSNDNRFGLVADLGLDEVLIYRFDAVHGTLAPNNPPLAKLPPGSGPRHIAFHPNGKVVYVISELANTLSVFGFDRTTGALHQVQILSTLPPGFKGANAAAEVQINRVGGVLYGSNRGDDSIAVFSIDPARFTLTPVEYPSSGGRTPRYFGLIERR